jgi:hypothetical protein
MKKGAGAGKPVPARFVQRLTIDDTQFHLFPDYD